MVQLSPLPDMSRFVRKKDRVSVHGTVLFLLDGSVVECSGTVLAARSPHLEKHLVKNYEVVLDEYVGGVDQLKQCLKLLYGGEVTLCPETLPFFLRFSVQFEIEELLGLCEDWITNNYNSQFPLVSHQPTTASRLRLVDDIQKRITSGKVISSSCLASCKCTDSSSCSDSSGIDLTDFPSTEEDELSDVTPHHVSPHSHCTQDISRVTPLSDTNTTNHDMTRNAGPAHDVDYSECTSVSDSASPHFGSRSHEYISDYTEYQIPPELTPDQISNPELAYWMNFSIQDIERLCTNSCAHPDFVKMEVTISWLTSPNCRVCVPYWQEFLDRVFTDIDPAHLCPNYLAEIDRHLNDFYDLKLSQNQFDVPNVARYRKPEFDNGTTRYRSLRWRVRKPEDKRRLATDLHHSYFAECHLCEKRQEWQEVVVRLADQTPCYDLKQAEGFTGARTKQLGWSKHHHSTAAVHWFITRTVKSRGGQSAKELVSFVTTSLDKLLSIISTEEDFRIHCLQIRSF